MKGGLGNLMKQAQQMQENMKAMQEKLASVEVEGQSGAGMVKATVNGKKQLIALDIDPVLLKADDRIVLQDLIVAAVNKAAEEADVLAKEELRKSTDGLLPNIPGMDLSGLMG